MGVITRKSIFLLLIPILFLGLLVSFGFPAKADVIDDLRQQIGSKSQEIKELEKKAEELNEQIKSKQGLAQTLKTEISKIEARIKKLMNDVQLTQTKISQSLLSIERIKLEIGRKETELNQRRYYLADILRTLNEYENEGQLTVFLKNQQFSDFLDQVEYVGGLEKELNYNIAETNSLKDQLEGEKRDLENKKKELETQKKNLTGQKNIVEDQKDEKSDLLKTTKNQEKNYQQILSDVEKKRRAIETEMYRLEDKLQSLINPSQIPAPKPGMFSWPITNARVTQWYGMTAYAKTGAYGGGPHTGIDMTGGFGTPVRAAQAGIVKYSGDLGRYSYGKWIYIEHDNGLATLYGHLSGKTVQAGQQVQVGDVIGYEGSTGYSTGPHLHFGLYLANTVQLTESKIVKGLFVPMGFHIDPKNYL